MTDSPAVLRLQTRNQRDGVRPGRNNVSNREAKSSRTGSAPPRADNSENQDPLKSKPGQKTAFRPKVSRLPVPVKSGQPPTHDGWEDQPLTGKVMTKTQRCATRPVPFALSRPRGSRTACNRLTSSAVLQCATSARTVRPNNKPRSVAAPVLGPSLPLTPGHHGNSTEPSSGVRGPAITPRACERGDKEKSSRSLQRGPQRVPVRWTREKTPAPTGSLKRARFSPDPAALRSILQNEGLKTDRPARSTSICSAQRVPVRRAAETCLTPAQRGSPQRVQDSRPKPVSSMKRFHLTHQPLSCPSHRLGNRSTCDLPREAVVQKLFEDPVDPEPDPVSPEPDVDCSELRQEVPGSGVARSPDESGRQRPLQQHQPRDSVIFFSAAKKTFRCAHLEKRRHGVDRPQPGRPTCDASSAGREATCLLMPPQGKSGAPGQSPASALLPQRPLLEDRLLDLEISTYTSTPASGYTTPGPRCGNPVASFLLRGESMSFVPVVLDLCSTQVPSLQESPSAL